MKIRVYGSPEMHRSGRFGSVGRLGFIEGYTRCETRFVYGEWPKGEPRPRLPRCRGCFA